MNRNLVAFVVVGLLAGRSEAGSQMDGACDVKIESPHTKDSVVDGEIVTGWATVPSDFSLRVFVQRSPGPIWWPNDPNAAVPVNAEHHWETKAPYDKAAQISGAQMLVRAVVFNPRAHTELADIIRKTGGNAVNLRFTDGKYDGACAFASVAVTRK